jgi:ATP-dependent 26S proteasome regulatory subunit
MSDRPSIGYADVGGMDSILQELRELLEWPMTHPVCVGSVLENESFLVEKVVFRDD